MLVEVFYLSVALLLALLLAAAGVAMLRNERLTEQLPPILLTGATGSGILLLLAPVWGTGWLTDVALLVASATLAMVLGITRYQDSENGDNRA